MIKLVSGKPGDGMNLVDLPLRRRSLVRESVCERCGEPSADCFWAEVGASSGEALFLCRSCANSMWEQDVFSGDDLGAF